MAGRIPESLICIKMKPRAGRLRRDAEFAEAVSIKATGPQNGWVFEIGFKVFSNGVCARAGLI